MVPLPLSDNSKHEVEENKYLTYGGDIAPDSGGSQIDVPGTPREVPHFIDPSFRFVA